MNCLRTTYDGRRKVLTIRSKGDLLSTNVDPFAQEFETVLAENADTGWEALAFDFKQARMIDSTGLNLLQGMVRQVQDSGRQVRITISSPVVARVLRFSLLDQLAQVILHDKVR